MSGIQQLTNAPTEAELEARVHSALSSAFPWISEGLQHQKKFEFKFGRSTVTIDGEAVSKAQARLDILVKHSGVPLAVVELKREGTALTKDDEEQGLSYARMLHPRPPLVIVTNGLQTKQLETHTGNEWKPATKSEAEVHKLVQAAAKLATADLQRAVEVLLGPQSSVWVDALRAASERVLSELSGDFDEVGARFVRDFLVPRDATQQVLKVLKGPKRVVLVQGAPLIGKSSVLRDLVEVTRTSDELVTLFVEADGGASILQTIADLLGSELGWHVTVDDTREWLRKLSERPGPLLVLAIDGISAARTALRREVEDLSGDSFGRNLRIALSVDDSIAPRLLKAENGRDPSKLGRRAAQVHVEPLSDNEFRRLLRKIDECKLAIMHGGEFAPEFRLPWIMRTVLSGLAPRADAADHRTKIVAPPLLGPELLAAARRRFADHHDARDAYHALAQAVLDDDAEWKQPAATVLVSIERFLVRRSTLRQHLESADVNEMIGSGFFRKATGPDGDSIIVPTIPELLASEMAQLLAEKLREALASGNPDDAADWLIDIVSGLPFGDVIGAQAIVDQALSGEMPLRFMERLVERSPHGQKIEAGARLALYRPGAGMVDLDFQEDGRVVLRSVAGETVMSPEESADVSRYMHGDIGSWLVLSHLAGQRTAFKSPDGDLIRIDPKLLLEVGACPIVLRRPSSLDDMNQLLTHDLDDGGFMVCHKMGIVEPITLSILKFLTAPQMDTIDEWFEGAIARGSLPLLMRIDIALRELERHRGLASWAAQMRAQYIAPALDAALQCS